MTSAREKGVEVEFSSAPFEIVVRTAASRLEPLEVHVLSRENESLASATVRDTQPAYFSDELKGLNRESYWLEIRQPNGGRLCSYLLMRTYN